MGISNSFSPARIRYQNSPPISIFAPISPRFPSSSAPINANFFVPRPQSFSPLHFRRPVQRSFNNLTGRCRAASPGSPPPERDPNGEESSLQLTGIVSTLSRFQDTVGIFFAVFVWMSLFFWSSTWEGWNNDKPDKGSGFR